MKCFLGGFLCGSPRLWLWKIRKYLSKIDLETSYSWCKLPFGLFFFN